MQRTEKRDIYTRITNQIVSHLEKGVRPAFTLYERLICAENLGGMGFVRLLISKDQ